MRSNFKQLGEYIREVDDRNTKMQVNTLLGVSIEKRFIPSIANIIGTDMSTYKIVKRNQFAYGPVTSRNGDKISIALQDQYDEAIVSQAYIPFEITDPKKLNPEYLMMWFRRPEFDRYARFKSHGSAREIFDWEEMCKVMLPIPHPDKQRELVKEYNTIVNRINLNNQLINKIEETSQVIYKQWFVNFEFPDENGQPYKSSGGEMVESEKGEIPSKWKIDIIGNHIESASKQHKFNKKELIFFNTSDILEGDFLHNIYSPVIDMPGQAKKSIQRDDILYSEIRPANKRYALVRVNAEDYVVSTKLMVLRRIKYELSILRFYKLFTDEWFINILQQSSEGKSGTFPQITFEEDICNKPLIIADVKTEALWANYLSAQYSYLFQRKDEIKALYLLRSLALAKLSNIEN